MFFPIFFFKFLGAFLRWVKIVTNYTGGGSSNQRLNIKPQLKDRVREVVLLEQQDKSYIVFKGLLLFRYQARYIKSEVLMLFTLSL